MAKASDADILALFEQLALAAGREIMDVFHAGIVAEAKADASPVTEADRRAEIVILAGLRAHLPEFSCVAEEEVSAGHAIEIGGHAFFLVDPLDGTREFVKRNPDFTVNIALVIDGVPKIGVVYAPARAVLYGGRPGEAYRAAVGDFTVSDRSPIRVRKPAETLTIVASRSHPTQETTAYVASYGAAELVSIGSSLKFCLLAAGEADLYPRFGRTMEWDTAAGDAILRAAGGRVTRVDGSPLLYGKRNQPNDADFANPWFLASGDFEPVLAPCVADAG